MKGRGKEEVEKSAKFRNALLPLWLPQEYLEGTFCNVAWQADPQVLSGCFPWYGYCSTAIHNTPTQFGA